MEGKVAVLGNADFVMPFSALGVDTYLAEQTDEKMAESAEKIISGRYALVVVAENIAPAIQEAFSAQMDTAIPCIVVVPFTTESEGFATQALAQVLKIATGVNIMQDN
jgi:vacuolar-type H+-ATPase subunit F/Vma7